MDLLRSPAVHKKRQECHIWLQHGRLGLQLGLPRRWSRVWHDGPGHCAAPVLCQDRGRVHLLSSRDRGAELHQGRHRRVLRGPRPRGGLCAFRAALAALGCRPGAPRRCPGRRRRGDPPAVLLPGPAPQQSRARGRLGRDGAARGCSGGPAGSAIGLAGAASAAGRAGPRRRDAPPLRGDGRPARGRKGPPGRRGGPRLRVLLRGDAPGGGAAGAGGLPRSQHGADRRRPGVASPPRALGGGCGGLASSSS
mmetsp:Transcript_19990/g.56425  ORF Transcript_19990/g.56425 Transcript_19990/m.56425 type:complete len:251 (+) Transcript_19990:1609-2361(+)